MLKGKEILLICSVVLLSFFVGCGDLPELPVEVSYRPSRIGVGGVAIFTNTSNETIEFEAQVRNPKTKEQVKYMVTLRAGESKELGWMQDWAWEPGETLLLRKDGYKDARYTVEKRL